MNASPPSTSSYLKSGRLSDVLALVQILAYHKLGKRSNDGLLTDLRRGPVSTNTWIEIGQQHPELFRVLEADRHHSNKETVTLIARFVQEPIPSTVPDEPPKSPPLTPDQTAKLMELAVQLHDREVQRRDRWKTVIVPMVVAIIAAGASVVAAIISSSKSGNQGMPPSSSLPTNAVPAKSHSLPAQAPLPRTDATNAAKAPNPSP